MFTTLNTNNLSKKFITIFLGILIIFLSGCQTIKKKSDEVAEKENEKFGQFVGKEVNEMRLELGTPTEDYVNELGNEMLVYKTKKYGIPCERKFEVNTSGVIIGFSSSGCI
ncbi:hypothetical protein OA670_00800 [Candidatus Pelagibacter sp.]|mgnify:FL=1|nr:hypothetical protein [Candidatus Pelagibacter sp.]MDC3163741.1 hypothetical protein [Candidatus Pelagibacter sp.]|tara:strand:- start:190 stop:522 length:333 start_codon:yes stop_codon:yes gene_type:complete